MLEQDLFLLVNPQPDSLGGHAHLEADLLEGLAIDQPQFEHPSVIDIVAVFSDQLTDLAVRVLHPPPP